MMGFNFSVAVWVGYIALFGIAVERSIREALRIVTPLPANSPMKA